MGTSSPPNTTIHPTTPGSELLPIWDASNAVFPALKFIAPEWVNADVGRFHPTQAPAPSHPGCSPYGTDENIPPPREHDPLGPHQGHWEVCYVPPAMPRRVKDLCGDHTAGTSSTATALGWCPRPPSRLSGDFIAADGEVIKVDKKSIPEAAMLALRAAGEAIDEQAPLCWANRCTVHSSDRQRSDQQTAAQACKQRSDVPTFEFEPADDPVEEVERFYERFYEHATDDGLCDESVCAGQKVHTAQAEAKSAGTTGGAKPDEPHAKVEPHVSHTGKGKAKEGVIVRDYDYTDGNDGERVDPNVGHASNRSSAHASSDMIGSIENATLSNSDESLEMLASSGEETFGESASDDGLPSTPPSTPILGSVPMSATPSPTSSEITDRENVNGDNDVKLPQRVSQALLLLEANSKDMGKSDASGPANFPLNQSLPLMEKPLEQRYDEHKVLDRMVDGIDQKRVFAAMDSLCGVTQSISRGGRTQQLFDERLLDLAYSTCSPLFELDPMRTPQAGPGGFDEFALRLILITLKYTDCCALPRIPRHHADHTWLQMEASEDARAPIRASEISDDPGHSYFWGRFNPPEVWWVFVNTADVELLHRLQEPLYAAARLYPNCARGIILRMLWNKLRDLAERQYSIDANAANPTSGAGYKWEAARAAMAWREDGRILPKHGRFISRFTKEEVLEAWPREPTSGEAAF